MGSWGPFSSQSDMTYDALWAKNIHKMTDAEVKDSLRRFMKENPLPWDWSQETIDMLTDYIGVITHCLFQARTVPMVHLKRAKKILGHMLDPEWCKWSGRNGPDEKTNALKIELAAVEYAIRHKGKGKKYHVPGLLEQIAEALSHFEAPKK